MAYGSHLSHILLPPCCSVGVRLLRPSAHPPSLPACPLLLAPPAARARGLQTIDCGAWKRDWRPKWVGQPGRSGWSLLVLFCVHDTQPPRCRTCARDAPAVDSACFEPSLPGRVQRQAAAARGGRLASSRWSHSLPLPAANAAGNQIFVVVRRGKEYPPLCCDVR